MATKSAAPSPRKPAASSEPVRCVWANPKDPLYLRYHDEEWGVPCTDETQLFEMLNLEGAQAGLSWSTVLNKRENYRRAFEGWDAGKIARYDGADVERLLQDAGIIRNRLKIEATIANAHAVLALRDEFGGLVPYLWSWVGAEPIVNRRPAGTRPLSQSPLSEAISKDLAKRGFRFIGPTIVYAYMQAVGVIDDHDARCFRHAKHRL
jgi:DNA-3-methyladenine glycosylase I